MRISEIHGYVVKIRGAAYLGGQPAAAGTARRGDYVRHRHYRSAYSTNTETFLVKIVTEDGTYGWGEAQAPLMPEVAAHIVERLIGPFLLGTEVTTIGAHWHDAYDSMRERGHWNGYQLDAIAACDIALWDLKGKLLGRPIADLGAGRYRDHIPCYVSGLPTSGDDARAELARTWYDRGFRAFKLALGTGIDSDVATFTRVREEVGPVADMYVDAHWRYTVPEAITLGHRLEAYGLGFLEAPVAPEDAEGQAAVARALTVPVAVGEELRTAFDVRDRLTRGAANLVQPDVGRMGITQTLDVAALAAAFHVPVALHLGVGLGVYIAASLHAAAAIENLLTVEYQPTQLAAAHPFLRADIDVDGGYYRVPQGPGLGIEVNLETVFGHITHSFTITHVGA